MAIVASYNVSITVRDPDGAVTGDPVIKPLRIEQLEKAIADAVQSTYWDQEPGGQSVKVNVAAQRTDR